MGLFPKASLYPFFIALVLNQTPGPEANAQSLGEALNAGSLVWSTGGDLPWQVDSATNHDGVAAVSSGNLALGQANWLQTTVTGPTAITFWVKRSSCSKYSPLKFTIGGALQASFDGVVDWQEHSYFVPPGAQSLLWSIRLDCTGSSMLNRVWLDQVSFADPVAPVLVLQPTNQTVAAGDPVLLSASALGTEPFAYQWRLNGANIAGATQTSLSIPDAQAANAGDYTLMVSSPVGSITSQVAVLAVLPLAPLFTCQPLSQGTPIGATVSFMTAVKGTEPFGGWQWYSNGVRLAGASSATLRISNVRTSNFANYWVVVTNACGNTTSAVATLSYSPVAVWGDTSKGQGFVPAGATNVAALCGGDFHLVALRGDGTVIAWGTNDWDGQFFGQLLVPASATNVVGIGAGSSHSLAVRQDGEVVLWGQILHGGMGTFVPAEATNVVAAAQGSGANHVLALRGDGSVIDWGNRYYGLTNPPVSATGVVAVAAGAYHALALRGDGTLVGWGDNSSGQLNIPATATNVVAIACGWFFNLALRADGTLVQWPASSSVVPTQATNIIAISCGGGHRLALRADGKVFAWGGNTAGQLSIPTWVSNVVAVAAANNTSLALLGAGAPLICEPPVSRSVLVGDTTFLRAAAVGSWPLSYQWQLNGTNLPGATGLVLMIPNTQLAQAGVYSVVVSNALGTVTSQGAAVSVLPKAAIILADTLEVLAGRFTFQATGAPGFNWRVQGSTNLADWVDYDAVTNATGTMSFSGPATNGTQGFYRLRLAR